MLIRCLEGGPDWADVRSGFRALSMADEISIGRLARLGIHSHASRKDHYKQLRYAVRIAALARAHERMKGKVRRLAYHHLALFHSVYRCYTHCYLHGYKYEISAPLLANKIGIQEYGQNNLEKSA